MDDSLQNLLQGKKDENRLEKIPDGHQNLDCIPVSQRSLFTDPDAVPGGMTKSMTVILLIIAIVTICINLGVIVRIRKLIRRMGDPKPAFFFIGNLAISDFLVGFYVTAVFCIDLTQFSSDWRNSCCGFLTAVVVTACQETICTIVLIAVDKYIFICHGLSYRCIVTRKKVLISIGLSWCGSIIIGFLPAFGLHEDDWCVCSFLIYINKTFSIILFLTAVVLPITTITFMYSVILSLAIQVARRKQGKHSTVTSTELPLTLQCTSSKSSNATLSSRISGTDTAIVHLNPTVLHPEQHGNGRMQNVDFGTGIRETSGNESASVNDILPSNVLAHKTSSLPTVVELQETELVATYESDSSEEGENGFTMNGKEGRCVSLSFTESQVTKKCYKEAHSNFTTDTCQRYVENKPCSSESHEGSKCAKINVNYTSESTSGQRQLKDSSENVQKVEDSPTNLGKKYYKKLLVETRDKVQFLQKCQAIKTIFLIIFCFTVTYVPFVTGTFSFKLQNDSNDSLFKALNNLLYFAVVLNSLMNPFVYAYGYKEFRIRTKNFKGILARDKRRRKNMF